MYIVYTCIMSEKTSAILNIRIDKNTKKKAQKTFGEMGLDISSGVKMFLHSVIMTQTIPFTIRTESGFTKKRESALLSEIESTKKDAQNGKIKKYLSGKDLLNDILKK